VDATHPFPVFTPYEKEEEGDVEQFKFSN